jgi:SagB-type dehydrogenase family enzyme
MSLDPHVSSCLALAPLAGLVAACASPTEKPGSGPVAATAPAAPAITATLGDPDRTVFELPPPERGEGTPLAVVLSRRRSVREFDSRPLRLAELSQLLWAAQGVSSTEGGRTAPSAGATYPLEVHAVLAEGVFRYEPEGHRLERLDGGDQRAGLAEAALDQRFVAAAPAVLVIAGVEARTAERYGDRAGRYVALEAGAAAENVLLQAEALGLAAVWVGAFDDERVASLVLLPDRALPYAMLPVGPVAKEGTR